MVDSGPYGIVRHPIYTGILLAILATMAAKGTIPAVAGALVIILGLWMKARLEEGFLREQLGAEAYDAYRLTRIAARSRCCCRSDRNSKARLNRHLRARVLRQRSG